ncbi:MAG: hypothetical protein RsTaC01_0526 [Candidatus Paraimprobicoccus trichonymphae]|uniref:Uncharacterized protein n=1 Tax=Candidatus Paraimprobicoccus trichonymphae TaxID=3033793 RepID=A0AA48HZR4_9FIRM|nr:MAG: hypothetical protein RsTaC01_0526 [Candidatus Paraimprobicoccus trichonymphae]
MPEKFIGMPNLNNLETCNNFKEAVCVDAYRVYDSCADKDCLENLRVHFTPESQAFIDQANNVRIREVDVINVYLDLEPVPFQKGFYSVDMMFCFKVSLDVVSTPSGCIPTTVSGLCVFNKKVILYGSEGNVRIYSSDFALDENDTQNLPVRNLPKACVQVADPIGLSVKLCEIKECSCCDCCEPSPCWRIPSCICKRFGGEIVTNNQNAKKVVAVTIGLFTIVQIERNVQMLIPAYDFCIPEKQCSTSSDNPCELFSRIEFPTNEFFPTKPKETAKELNINNFNNGFNCCGKKTCN